MPAADDKHEHWRAAMADDLSKKGPQDSSRINLSERWEVDYWTRTLGVSKEELEKAVRAVGSSAAAVRRHLGKAA
jgi:hypothetical protein